MSPVPPYSQNNHNKIIIVRGTTICMPLNKPVYKLTKCPSPNFIYRSAIRRHASSAFSKTFNE